VTRPIVQLHTIQQWFQLAPEVRSVILQNIKLKDRLQRFLIANQNRPPIPDEGKWVPCKRCATKGYVQIFPRHAGIHPSQVVHACMLRVYWQILGKEERARFNANTLITFDIGHAVHDMVQGYGKAGAWGPSYQPEVKITNGSHPLATELFIEGSADAENILVIDDIPNAPIYEVGLVHEYKTIKSVNFAKLTRPKPEHKQQATIYSAVLDRPIVAYLYLCKDDSTMSDFPVEFDPTLWGQMKGKIDTIIRHYDAGTSPPSSTGYHCTECPFYYDCTDGQNHKKPAARRT
jgi:CRISPR/Cas system-associated exonuclease Cas4 (RecB family)